MRTWLASKPEGFRRRDYKAFAEEANLKRKDGDRPLPSDDAVATSLRINWESALAVARGEKTLQEVRDSRTAELLQDLSDSSLVSAEVVVLMIDIQTRHLPWATKQDGFPQPVARVGRNRAWLLGDLKAYRDGQPVFKRAEWSFQDKVIDAVELSQALDFHPTYFRTLLSEEAWHRIPRPDGRVGKNYYWLRDGLKKRLPKAK